MPSQGLESPGLGGRLQSLSINLSNYVGDKTVDIRALVADITFYENLFAPTMHGVITIVDALGLLSGYGPFQILGEETLRIEYNIADDIGKGLSFFVYKIAPILNVGNLKQKRYALSFCSFENLVDSTVAIQKSYKTSNADAVKNILSEFLKTEKSFSYEPTKGIQHVVVPKMSPLSAIDMFRRRSISATKYTSASYQFYETTDGFAFNTIEYLIEKGLEKIKKDPETYTYYISEDALQRTSLDNQNTDPDDPRNYNLSEFKTLFDFQQKHKADTIEKLKRGVYQSVTNVFDPITMKMSSSTFLFKDGSTKTTGKYPENTETFIEDYKKYGRNGPIFYLAIDSSIPDSYLDEVIGPKNSYMTRLSQNMFEAKTPGDPRIVVGDLIEIPNVPAYRDPDGYGNTDELLSGYFLIAGITHKLGQEIYAVEYELYCIGYSKKVEDSVQIPFT